jgi:exodeoxyribonuclease VII large subunit
MVSTTLIPALRLSELASAVADAIQVAFAQKTFWVVADITSHSHKADKNYHHLELVEKDPASHEILAKLHATAWGRGSQSIQRFEQQTGQRFTNSIQILVNVSVSYHAVYGLQLSINDVDVNFTLGALEQQRRATLERLVAENPDSISRIGDRFVTRNSQLPLRQVLQRIAVISSANSAGWQDFRHTLRTNPQGYEFYVDEYFALVQGQANAGGIVDRLIDIFNSQIPYDVVVIIRGGGAQTDLLIFDNYQLARAIARFPIPVITGIGHQKNESIADLMAKVAAHAPTKAAELICAHNRTFEDAIAAFQKTIIIKAQQQLSGKLQTLGRMNSAITSQAQTILFERRRQLLSIGSLLTSLPAILVANKNKDIRQIGANLSVFTMLYLKNARSYLGHYVSLVDALSPERTLQRGFAIIRANGRITSDPGQLVKGQKIEILLRDQAIHSTITAKTNRHGTDPDL